MDDSTIRRSSLFLILWSTLFREVLEDMIPYIEFEHMGVKEFLNIVVPSELFEKGK